MLLRDGIPQVALSVMSFALANVLPRQVVALLVALAVFVSTSPRRARREALLDEASNESSGNDVTEMSLLNTAVQEMWPEITSFIRTVLKETVEEAIQTRMPWFLSSLGFGRISFGDSALKVEELNVERLSQESYKDGEFRSFKVSSVVAWDADVDVALTAPFAAISAEHVLVKGRLDVCLQQILPRPPFFTAITFYFAELPTVLLSLDGTLVGLRVSLLWLEKLLAEIIQKQLAEQIVLPTVASVLLDITNEDAWFEAGHMFPEGVVAVAIRSAENLAAKDMALPFGLSTPSSDPYCEVTLGVSRWRTPVRPQNLNPKWEPSEATHQFLVHARSEQQLLLHFYDENPYTEDVSLGYVSLPVGQLPSTALASEPEQEMTLPLSLQGSVHFSACFSELKLDEANLRRQLRCLDDERSRKRRAFVVMVGVDRCIFSGSEDAKPRGFLCKVSCEEHEETFKSRVARKRGRYGATAWWRRAVEESSPSAAEGHAESEEQEEENAAHFQATFTHMIQGDPRSTVCHIKIEKRGALPVGKDVGELDFPVYRLISAAFNTTKVVLPMGSATLTLLAQLRATARA
ncbi:Extended synaptotagmin-2 (E-Syt2) [Durusdinium trenchii]